MPFLQRPVQIAYFVSDVVESAARMSTTLGAGPFHVIRRIQLARGRHRGNECRFLHSSAYGQWGDVMLELVQQDEEGPSPFRDMFGPGEEGLHHLAFFVPDLDAAIERGARLGMPLAARALTTGGVDFAFLDATASLGHMIELYVPDPRLSAFYRLVRDAAAGWDGSDPVRVLQPAGSG